VRLLTDDKPKTPSSKTLELLESLVTALASLADSDSSIRAKHGESINEVKQLLGGTKEAPPRSAGKPAVKSHTSRLPEDAKIRTSHRVTDAFTSPKKPTHPSTRGSPVAKASRSTPTVRKRSTKSKTTKGKRVKCSLCNYSAPDIGALSKHRAKKHPQAQKRSAQKAKKTRSTKPKSSMSYQPIDYNAYVARAQSNAKLRGVKK